jgi:hypothetical protein
MSFAQGVAVEMAYVKEVAHGTTPASPAMKRLRLTQRNINGQANAIRSEIVEAHEQVTDSRQGFRSVVGSFGFELAFGGFDDLIPAAIDGGAWGAAGGTPEFPGATMAVKMSNAALQTFTVERRFTDILKYQLGRGVAINQFGLQIQADQPLIRGTMDMLGMSYGDMTGTTIGAPTDLPKRPSMIAFQGDVEYDGTPIGVVTGLNFTVNGQRQLQAVVGDYYSPDVFKGQKQIAGQITAMLTDASAFYSDFFQENEVSMKVKLMDPNGTDFIGISLPRIKINSATIEPGQVGPILINSDIEILRDATKATSMIIERTGS